jgi:hypothetical protein
MPGCGQPITKQPEPRVGIFWFIDGKLILDSTPLSMAEPYGTALTHPTSHIDYWERLQRKGVVPVDCEYEEPARGRVVYDGREQKYSLMADRCILGRRDVVAEIMEAMHLPEDTALSTDDHYRCYRCLASRNPFNGE